MALFPKTPKKVLKVSETYLVKEWNDPRDPAQFTVYDRARVKWKCGLNHEWEAPIFKRWTSERGCDSCVRLKLTLPQDSLGAKHPEFIKEWSDKNTFSIMEVTPGSTKQVWWKCSKCNHEWQCRIIDRTTPERSHPGKFCPACVEKLPWRFQRKRGF